DGSSLLPRAPGPRDWPPPTLGAEVSGSPLSDGASHDLAKAAQMASGSPVVGRRVGSPALVNVVSGAEGADPVGALSTVVGSSGATTVRVRSAPQDAHWLAPGGAPAPRPRPRPSPSAITRLPLPARPFGSGHTPRWSLKPCHIGYPDAGSAGESYVEPCPAAATERHRVS